MNVKKVLLEKIKDGTFALFTDEQISRKLHLGRREALGLRDMLRALVREGELLCDSSFRYGTAMQFGAKQGVITGNERGFGFFVPDDGSGDLFLPHRAMKGALHGDTVLAFCTGGRSGDEGEVLAILQRGMKKVVGTFTRAHRGGFLHPDERRFSEEIFIPAARIFGCPNGAKAVAKITSYDGGAPMGEIVEVLGTGGELQSEELAVIRAHELHEKFPPEVIREGEREARRSPLEGLEGRVDLRDKLIITIDGEDTRDIDDAVSVEKKGDKYELGVHIADVSHYVLRGSALDNEAFARGTSVYFPDRVLPMLPPSLSNGICSLNEGEVRLTLSCFMTVDRQGKVIKKRVAPSVILSRHRMTYTAVTRIAEGDEEAVSQYPDLVDFVKIAVELTNILKTAREKRGSVTLETKEAKILFSDGVISIPDFERTISHEMIEQFMVLANESVAALMSDKNMPFVYRVHEKPSEEKARSFLEFLREVGVPAKFDPENVTSGDYQRLLKSLDNSPLLPIVSRIALRSMMKAVYSPENTGHFGLASDCYCHFTSPIRRYPDLCIHRIIKEALVNEERARAGYQNVVQSAAVHSSVCERNAQEAERDMDALYVVAYMSDKIGEEYEATLSGVTSFGLFAELGNTVEGFIPLETLPDERYEFFEERFLLRGNRNSFRLGERVKVKVVGVDWGTRRVQFALLEKIV